MTDQPRQRPNPDPRNEWHTLIRRILGDGFTAPVELLPLIQKQNWIFDTLANELLIARQQTAAHAEVLIETTAKLERTTALLEETIRRGEQLRNGLVDRMRELAMTAERKYRSGPELVIAAVLMDLADQLDPPLSDFATGPVQLAHCPDCEAPREVIKSDEIEGMLTCVECGTVFCENEIDSTAPPADGDVSPSDR